MADKLKAPQAKETNWRSFVTISIGPTIETSLPYFQIEDELVAEYVLRFIEGRLRQARDERKARREQAKIAAQAGRSGQEIPK